MTKKSRTRARTTATTPAKDAPAPEVPRPVRGPPTPGAVLYWDYLQPAGVSEGAFAKHAGIKLPSLSRIIWGSRRLKALNARRIAKATDTEPAYWLGLQAAREIWLSEQRDAADVEVMDPFKWLRAGRQARASGDRAKGEGPLASQTGA